MPNEGAADRPGAAQFDPKPSSNHGDKPTPQVVTLGLFVVGFWGVV
jgi:hypothetical protein